MFAVKSSREKTGKSNARKIDTSIAGYEYIGIKLTEEQIHDLTMINIMLAGNTGKRTPVHCILLVLKVLGILPPELVSEVCNDEAADNTESVCKDEFEKRFGRIKY